ncbi:PREDICTED: uncharacterized protein LOC106751435 isoform X2 [Dinoponera quadriceps]|uniref:Uncharacterized protein LOC106751435 isoform X1 n=1 Tax=Dinoponera quadriceps TaxID=609295 RepID=A0A6P3YA35_DINQU|nr:PREDICTED: uncharacterized protein LOC106751435 isoform X1 [Dinoponera quadriceps]XP_014487811.1 PREDICTED: uncharacterized protein LOC106751435 isoform X2 [Dinoponera quadriceps]
MFFGTCFLCSFIAESMSYGIASIFSHAVISMFIGSTITCFMVLFLMQSIGQPYPLPLYRTLLMHMTYIQYVLEAFLTAAYGNGRKRLHCPLEKIYCQYSTPKEILRIMGKNF